MCEEDEGTPCAVSWRATPWVRLVQHADGAIWMRAADITAIEANKPGAKVYTRSGLVLVVHGDPEQIVQCIAAAELDAMLVHADTASAPRTPAGLDPVIAEVRRRRLARLARLRELDRPAWFRVLELRAEGVRPEQRAAELSALYTADEIAAAEKQATDMHAGPSTLRAAFDAAREIAAQWSSPGTPIDALLCTLRVHRYRQETPVAQFAGLSVGDDQAWARAYVETEIALGTAFDGLLVFALEGGARVAQRPFWVRP